MSEFVDRLNEQVGESFAASQEYLAMGVHYRLELLPRLAAVCYDRALEERDRALSMVTYLVDAGAPAVVPGIAAPRATYADVVEPLELAIDRDHRMADRAGDLARLARDSGDFASEQFMKRIIQDQSRGLSAILSLLVVARRSRKDPMRIEEFLAGATPSRMAHGRFARTEPVVEAIEADVPMAAVA